MSKRCDGCEWWVEKGNEFGDCRRYPPIHEIDVVGSRCPVTFMAFWCGEFTARVVRSDSSGRISEELADQLGRHLS